MPVLRNDTQASADERAAEFYEGRLRYFWDKMNATGFAYQPVLDWPDMVWDVYLLYSRNAKWTVEAPPVPEIYMHQRGEEFKKAPAFNRQQLETKIKELLLSKRPAK